MSCVDYPRLLASGKVAPRSFCPSWSVPKLLFWKRPCSFQHCKAIVWNGAWTILKVPVPPGAVARCLAKLRVALKDKLLLVTIRTKAEGGETRTASLRNTPICSTLILDTDCADLHRHRVLYRQGHDLPALIGARPYRRGCGGLLQP